MSGDAAPSMFDKFGGYYSVRFSGVEFARFAPSTVWSQYVRMVEDVPDFSYVFIATDGAVA